MMELQFLGHACFLLDDGSYKVLTDPFLSGTGQTALAETVEPDFIFVTHGHGDHVGDAVEISKRTGAPVCCTVDLSCGFIFEMGGKKIYHAGDTALMTDMALLEDAHIDVALLPIGDFYTMGPADALRAVKMIKPGLTIPMHYNTFPPIAQDPAAFAAACEAAGFQAKVLQPGETLTV